MGLFTIKCTLCGKTIIGNYTKVDNTKTGKHLYDLCPKCNQSFLSATNGKQPYPESLADLRSIIQFGVIPKQEIKTQSAGRITADRPKDTKPIIMPEGWKRINKLYKQNEENSEYCGYALLFCEECESKYIGYWGGETAYDIGDVDSYLIHKVKGTNIRRYEDSSKFAKDEIEINREQASFTGFMKSINCPLCGGKFIHESGNKKVNPQNTVFENLEHEINWFLEYNVGKYYFSKKVDGQFLEKATSFVEENDIPTTTETTPSIREIKNDSERLKSYILQLIHMETNAFALCHRLEFLYKASYHAEKMCKREALEMSVEYKDTYMFALEKLKKIKSQSIEHPSVTRPTKPQRPMLESPGLFNKSKVQAKNAVLISEYNTLLEEYNKALASCEAEERRLYEVALREHEEAVTNAEKVVDDAKAILDQKTESFDGASTPAITWKNRINSDITAVEGLLKKTLECKNEMYSYDIVFSKYRNIVALSTFYEYLIAGRCTALEGADGAYNIYENEIRADMVISQLSSVLEKLEDIKKNQYMLYSELHTVNKNLSDLNSKMDAALRSLDTIKENTAQMEYNTAATAFYSKKNAELTDALGFMMALK